MIKYILGLIINLFNPAVSLFVKIDDKSSVDKKAKIYAKARIFNSVIGAYSYVGRNTSIVHARIGKFCSIAGGSSIGLGTHTLDKLSTSSIFTEKNNGTTHSWVKNNIVNPYKKIIIGNDVWIGARAMIMGGVTIGDGAVIAAGAIVTKDVPPYAVVGGIPAKIIKYRFEKQIIDKLIEIKWWNLSEDILRDNIELFQKNILVEEELMYLSKK
mgnify:CR=1 FL=1